jgi:allantoicase
MTPTAPTLIPAFLMAYSDSSFTNPHEVVKAAEPENRTGDFTHMGAKYWGFETVRHRATTVLSEEQALAYDHNAYHWLHIGFKKRAQISQIKISTKWFTGNQVKTVSVVLLDKHSGTEHQVLTRVSLNPDAEHSFDIAPTPATECRVLCFHEGGISRINLFGQATAIQPPVRDNVLASAEISQVSNEHYGSPLMAVKGVRAEEHMVGWESARNGFGEQALFHLAQPTVIDEIIVDTYMHRLNPPLSCHVFGLTLQTPDTLGDIMAYAPRWQLEFSDGSQVIPDNFQAYMLAEQYLQEKVPNNKQFKIKLHHKAGSPWRAILPFAPLRADTYHQFDTLADAGAVTHVLYMHYPNGGVHGLKMFGHNLKAADQPGA